MDQYTPPEIVTPAPKPKFFASFWKATAVLLFLSIPIFGVLGYFSKFYAADKSTPINQSIGYVAGTAIGGVFWALLFSFIVYLISKRSALATNLTCLIMLGLLTLGNLSTTAVGVFTQSNTENVSNDKALADLNRAIAAHRAEATQLFVNPDEIDQGAVAAHGARGLEIIREALPSFQGPLQESLNRFVVSTDRMDASTEDYDRWYLRFEDESLTPFTEDSQVEEVDTRIEIIREWLKANEKVRNAVQQWTQLKAFRNKLKTKQERDFYHGLTLSMEKQAPHLMIIRDTDRELGEIFIEVLELHKQEWGKFTPDGGLLNTIFESPEAQQKLADIFATLNDVVVRQEEAQKAILTG